MRNPQATHNLLAVSASKREPGLNEPQAVDTLLRVALGDAIKTTPQIETNADEITGKEEPDTLYALGAAVEGQLTFSRAQPQHLALLAAYGLGQCSSAAAGSGYLHTITPLAGYLEAGRSNPTLTAVQRLGDSQFKRLYASLMVDSLSLSAEKGGWLKISAALKGSGKTATNLAEEDVAGDSDATTITLARNAVEGDSAQARLDSVHQVRWRKSGDSYWQEVECAAVSSATPAVLTITPPNPSASDAGTYRVLYVPDEDTALETGSATADPPNDDTGVLTDSAATMTEGVHPGRCLVMTSGQAAGRWWPISGNTATSITCAGVNLYSAGVRSGDSYLVRQFGWLPMPGTLVAEPPLRVSQLRVVYGGQWDGSEFRGGRTVAYELSSVQWTLNNKLRVETTPGAGQARIANLMEREGREQSLTLSRRLVDAVLQQRLGDQEPEYFGLHLVAEGPEYESGYRYLVELILPRVALQAADLGLDGRLLSESVTLAVLEDDTHGSVIVRVRNTVPAYAQ